MSLELIFSLLFSLVFQNNKEVERVDGANAPELTRKIRQKADEFVPNPVSPPERPKEVSIKFNKYSRSYILSGIRVT